MEFYDVLVWRLGFPRSNVLMLDDKDPEFLCPRPTGKNIKDALTSLVQKAKDGDTLFVHFSGHGTQVPTDDPDEPDGLDECIVPCDFDIITDDELKEIFAPLEKKDVKLTFVADCCHSGTLLDHKQVIITGPKSGGRPPPKANAKSMQKMREHLGPDNRGRSVKARSLPYEDLREILSEKMGKKADMGNMRANVKSMKGMFGEDFGSSKSKALPKAKEAPKAGMKEDVGILVSGCLDKECSVDVSYCRYEFPHGAFSHAIKTLLEQLHEERALPISNRELVLAVRDILAKTGFRQSPCLECAEKWADTPFIMREDDEQYSTQLLDIDEEELGLSGAIERAKILDKMEEEWKKKKQAERGS